MTFVGFVDDKHYFWIVIVIGQCIRWQCACPPARMIFAALNLLVSSCSHFRSEG